VSVPFLSPEFTSSCQEYEYRDNFKIYPAIIPCVRLCKRCSKVDKEYFFITAFYLFVFGSRTQFDCQWKFDFYTISNNTAILFNQSIHLILIVMR
jgi:hypothetical protein